MPLALADIFATLDRFAFAGGLKYSAVIVALAQAFGAAGVYFAVLLMRNSTASEALLDSR